MGIYLNPGNSGFTDICNGSYVDPDALKGYGGEVLLVGVNDDKDAPDGQRKHTCEIRTLKKT